MEMSQTSLKVDSIIKDVKHIYEKFLELNKNIAREISDLEENIYEMSLNVDEHIKKEELNTQKEKKRSIASYIRKPESNVNIYDDFKKSNNDKLSAIYSALKKLSSLNDSFKSQNEKINDLKDELNELRSIVEKEIMLNIKINEKPPIEKTEYVYDIPPQLINSLNDAYKRVSQAREGIERMKIYEGIIGNLDKIH